MPATPALQDSSQDPPVSHAPVMMDPDQTLGFWSDWVRVSPGRDPFLTSVLPRWDQLIGYNPQMGPREIHDPAHWEGLGVEVPENPAQADELLPDLRDQIEAVVNRAAWQTLTSLTTTGDYSQAVEIDLNSLLKRIQRVRDPLARLALIEDQPVTLLTQLAWLITWWIQDATPTVVPTPPWTLPGVHYPTPRWDWANPPRPRWMGQVLHLITQAANR